MKYGQIGGRGGQIPPVWVPEVGCVVTPGCRPTARITQRPRLCPRRCLSSPSPRGKKLSSRMEKVTAEKNLWPRGVHPAALGLPPWPASLQGLLPGMVRWFSAWENPGYPPRGIARLRLPALVPVRCPREVPHVPPSALGKGALGCLVSHQESFLPPPAEAPPGSFWLEIGATSGF